MQETADILWESDLLWLTLWNFIFLITSFVHLKKEIRKQIYFYRIQLPTTSFHSLAEKAYFTRTAHAGAKHDILHVTRPWNESFCFMALKMRHILRYIRLTVLFRVKRISFPLEGVKNRILPIPSENYVPIGEYWKYMAKSRYLTFFLLLRSKKNKTEN